MERVVVIILNELTNTPHNAYFKVFASRQTEKQKAFMSLSSLQPLSQQLWLYLMGLRKIMLPPTGETNMSNEITPEYVLQLGEEIRQSALATYTISEVLAHYKPDEVLAHYKPDEVLAHYKPDEVLAHYKPLESYLTQREIQVSLKSLRKTLQLRLHMSDEQWVVWQSSLTQLNLSELEELTETALTVQTLSEFASSLTAKISSLSTD